jgi:hypothetical protein
LLLDLSLPDSTGIDTFRMVEALAGDVPINLIKDALHLVEIDHGPDARHAVFYVTRIVNRNLLAFARARSDAAAASLALLANNRLAVRNRYLPEDTGILAEAAAYAIVCCLDADALEFYEHIAGIA